MIKVISLMKRRDDMTLEEFRNWAFNEHPELGKKIPGMRRYHMSCVQEDSDTPFDVISEFWFDDVAALQAGFATLKAGSRRRRSRALLGSCPHGDGRQGHHTITTRRCRGMNDRGVLTMGCPVGFRKHSSPVMLNGSGSQRD
ncbi:MAG: EthD family reductase [Anaerolineales bacterium]|nr:EthD family reductase [Anaerolineales bacterium]